MTHISIFRDLHEIVIVNPLALDILTDAGKSIIEHVHQHGLAPAHCPPDVNTAWNLGSRSQPPPPAGRAGHQGGEEGGRGRSVEVKFVVKFEQMLRHLLLVRVGGEVVISHSPVVNIQWRG